MMNRSLEKKLEEILALVDEVESDTANVTRSEYREFLSELGSAVETREDGLGPDEEEDEAG